jgi:hypothetical protein
MAGAGEKPAIVAPAVVREEISAAAALPAANLPAAKKEQQLIIEITAPAIVKKEIAAGKSEDIPVAKPYKRSKVTRRAESSFTGGLGLVFIDEYDNGRKDTIRIVIPNPRMRVAETPEQARRTARFLDISSDGSAAATGRDGTTVRSTNAPRTENGNPACRELVSATDLSTLQKKMESEETNDGKIDEAKKLFRSKCITSGQLKDLSALFANDEGKYRLFDAAYPYVVDPEKFPALSSELKDEYYANRFRAMIR